MKVARTVLRGEKHREVPTYPTRWFRRGLSVADPFVCRCLTSPAVPRFHLPLIEPDVRICRIRLSDGLPRPAHGPVRRRALHRHG